MSWAHSAFRPRGHSRLQIQLGGGGGSGGSGLRVGEPVDVGGAVHVLPGENPEGGHRVHDLTLVGVENGQVQAAVQGLHQEVFRDADALRQAEADVGDAQHGVEPQLLSDAADGLQGLFGLILLGRRR